MRRTAAGHGSTMVAGDIVGEEEGRDDHRHPVDRPKELGLGLVLRLCGSGQRLAEEEHISGHDGGYEEDSRHRHRGPAGR